MGVARKPQRFLKPGEDVVITVQGIGELRNPWWRKGSMASFTVAQLSQLLGCQLHGPADLEIHGVSTIEKAGAGEITFLANMKYAPKVRGCRASAIIAAEPIKDFSGATLTSSNPYHDFARALAQFYQAPNQRLGFIRWLVLRRRR